MGLRLATKFSWTISGIVAISILSSLAALYGAWRINRRLDEAARESFPNVRAEEVEIILRQGNNLLASYLLDDGQAAWEKRFHEWQPRFPNWIATVHTANFVPQEEEDLLRDSKQAWNDLTKRQEEVLALVKRGEPAKAQTLLLGEIDGRLVGEIDGLCGQLIAVNERLHRRQHRPGAAESA